MKLFGTGSPDHPLADRKRARRILDELPAHDLKALEELAHWHESAGAAEGFKPDARAELLAMIDEAAQPRLRKLAREYLGAAKVQQNLLWARIHEYWARAADAYAPAVDAKAPAEVFVGALRALAQQLKWQHMRYGPVDPALWRRMNRTFALAEVRGMAAAKTEFLKAAVLGASSPDSLPVSEVELAERLIDALAAGFALATAPAPWLPYWIDLGAEAGPARVKQPPRPSSGLRFLGPGAALDRLRSLIAGLEKSGQVPAELRLAPHHDAETVLAVMRHLAAHWAPDGPERRHKRHSVRSRLKIAHGFNGVVEALAGAAAAENWVVENVSAGGFGALASQAKSDWLKVGVLLAAWPEGAPGWMVGAVRRVTKVSAQEVRVGVETLSRAPSVSQFALRNRGEAQGVLLSSVAGSTDASIALRAGVYARGDNLEATIGGKQRLYMPLGVAERGEDYEIVKFREMVRES